MTIVRRPVVGLLAAAAIAIAIAAAPLTASTAADLGTGDYVTVSNNGGVIHIGTAIPGQPLLGASVDTNTGRACVGFSKQVPFCTTAIGFDAPATAVPLPVWVSVREDGSFGAGVRIGTGSIVAVGYEAMTGAVCISVGMSDRYCTPPA